VFCGDVSKDLNLCERNVARPRTCVVEAWPVGPLGRHTGESLLGLLSVDGVVELLHLLLRQDPVAEVGLELLQRQLPVVWETESE